VKYVSLLRGINVSGKNRIKMDSLIKLYEDLKFANVQTYIQSGNVVFTGANEKPAALAARIESGILKAWKLEVPVIIRTAAEWKKLVAENPLIKSKTLDESSLYVAFLSNEVDPTLGAALKRYCTAGEEFHITGREVYLAYPAGAGKTKLTNAMLEKNLETVATSRNWRTTLTLREMCE
jgi:uncharacterized protein (DUF1697 family)